MFGTAFKGGGFLIENVLIQGEERASGGGGIENRSIDAVLTVIDTTISNNTSGNAGGGIWAVGGNTTSGAITTLIGVTFSGNTALNNGGAIKQETVGSLTITNSTLSGNTANGGGGGISASNGTITINNSTIASNTGTNAGGGILLESASATANVNSSIVANNVSSSGPDIAILAGTLNASNSLIEDGTINGTNTNNITATDPGLAPNGLQNNGGVTQTIALENGDRA